MNLLFWNLKNNSIEDHIVKCIIENDITIAAFAEYKGIDQQKIEKQLSHQYHFVQHKLYTIRTKVIILIKNSISAKPTNEHKRFSIYDVNTVLNRYILAVAHLEDKRNYNKEDRINTIKDLMDNIRRIEHDYNCDNTIIIGDFNANPYDEELLSIYAFNSILFKKVIKHSDIRCKNGVNYRCFFNPILNYISEDNELYGSFYCNSDSNTPYWHCSDQVLLRKSLIDCINDLQYLKTIDNVSLIKKIKPDSSISDHLPLFVKIEEVFSND